MVELCTQVRYRLSGLQRALTGIMNPIRDGQISVHHTNDPSGFNRGFQRSGSSWGGGRRCTSIESKGADNHNAYRCSKVPLSSNPLTIDQRYIPFEGAGLVSFKWELELPSTVRTWEYSTIPDVIMHLRYKSCDGGEKLASTASGAVLDFLQPFETQSQEDGLFVPLQL
jgi:hypothetical protein